MASPSPQQPPRQKPNPQHLRATLKRKLKGAKRLAVLAVGSSLRGDDAAGLLAAERLCELLKPHKISPVGETSCDAPGGRFAIDGVEIGVFVGETAPENLTGEIRRFSPSHVVILDAADFNLPVGEIDILDPQEIGESTPGSTHNLPMHVLTNYLRRELSCHCLIIGIQPSSVAFGMTVNATVAAAAGNVAQAMIDSLR